MLESILLSKHQPKDSRAVFHPLTVAKLTDPHETERNLPLFCHRMLSTSSASAPDWAQAKGLMEVSITSLSLVVFVRVTENYAAPMMSRSHALCRLFNTDRSGFK